MNSERSVFVMILNNMEKLLQLKKYTNTVALEILGNSLRVILFLQFQKSSILQNTLYSLF
jgi:hypothetical protein